MPNRSTRSGSESLPNALGPWIRKCSRLSDAYRSAAPWPHLVIDDFLNEEFASEVLREFPEPQVMPRSRDYIFGKKHELSSVGMAGPASARLESSLLSNDFASLVAAITGREIFIDPAFHGGGFHQGVDGSFLDFHVDFNVHPLHPNWLREINILLYLNRDWKSSYGGELLIRSSGDTSVTAIAPVFNRAVIMQTNESTYHGYRRMSLPPGVSRKSVATYGYTSIEVGSVPVHTTRWQPEGRSIIKSAVASQYDRLVLLKNRYLGSSTERNR